MESTTAEKLRKDAKAFKDKRSSFGYNIDICRKAAKDGNTHVNLDYFLSEEAIEQFSNEGIDVRVKTAGNPRGTTLSWAEKPVTTTQHVNHEENTKE